MIDKARDRFPYCIVWTPIPLITWLLPFIGHMGISDSEGRVHDFAGPYTIGIDDMAFGRPTRFLLLNGDKASSDWDEALEAADETYRHRMHNLCCDNCHSHVAHALENMKYSRKGTWNMVELCFWVFFSARYTSFAAICKSWLPFLVLAGLLFLLTRVVV